MSEFFCDNNDKLWTVNTKLSGIRSDIANALFGVFSDRLSVHRKLFVFRFDLSMDYYTPTNCVVSKLIARLRKRVEAHYKIKLCYCWVREQNKSKKQHYHFALFLNGSIVGHPHTLQSWIKLIWEQYGSCNWSRYYSLNRTDSKLIQSVSYHISYLAKNRTKGKRPKQTKDYGFSRRACISVGV